MIVSFNKYLEEKIKMKHPNGTYMSVKVSRATQKLLDKWSREHNIPNPIDPKDMHTTLVYSRKPVPESDDYPINFPIACKIKEWQIFPTGNEGKKCLVAVVESEVLQQHFRAIHTLYGASFDYPKYIPHITLSYDYGLNKVPTDLPDFTIVYDDKDFQPLDPAVLTKKD